MRVVLAVLAVGEIVGRLFLIQPNRDHSLRSFDFVGNSHGVLML